MHTSCALGVSLGAKPENSYFATLATKATMAPGMNTFKE